MATAAAAPSTTSLTPTEAVIVKVATQLGVDPRLALAIAYQESGLDPTAVGDNGTSFGLYQLHRGGELGRNTEAWAFNPGNNAHRALSQVALVAKQHPNWSPGQIAAAAQRPANPTAYAASVNAIYDSKRWQNVPATGHSGSASGSASSTSATGCAFGVGPFCIFSEAGLQKFYGALLMGAGGLVLTVGLGLVVIGALAETKLGKTATQAFGSAGMGKLVGAAAAPSRAVSGRRERRRATEAQAASQAASQQETERRRLSREQIDRARVRRERARARDAEARARRSSGTAAPQGFTQSEWNRLRREGRVSVKAS